MGHPKAPSPPNPHPRPKGLAGQGLQHVESKVGGGQITQKIWRSLQIEETQIDGGGG